MSAIMHCPICQTSVRSLLTLQVWRFDIDEDPAHGEDAIVLEDGAHVGAYAHPSKAEVGIAQDFASPSETMSEVQAFANSLAMWCHQCERTYGLPHGTRIVARE